MLLERNSRSSAGAAVVVLLSGACSELDLVVFRLAKRKRLRTYPELAIARRCKLVVLGLEVSGRFQPRESPARLRPAV